MASWRILIRNVWSSFSRFDEEKKNFSCHPGAAIERSCFTNLCFVCEISIGSRGSFNFLRWLCSDGERNVCLQLDLISSLFNLSAISCSRPHEQFYSLPRASILCISFSMDQRHPPTVQDDLRSISIFIRINTSSLIFPKKHSTSNLYISRPSFLSSN